MHQGTYSDQHDIVVQEKNRGLFLIDCLRMGCLLKRLPGIWEIPGARKKIATLQLFYFDQNSFGRARANALIRKNDRCVLDFASQHFEIDVEVAEIGQFACRLAPARRWEQMGICVTKFSSKSMTLHCLALLRHDE